MFLHMYPIKTEFRNVNGVEFEFMAFTVRETGETRIQIARAGSGVGPILCASLGVTQDMANEDKDVVDMLIGQAVHEIETDEDGQFDV